MTNRPKSARTYRSGPSNARPQKTPRRGTTALVPGISLRWSETPRWAGWEIRASRQEPDGRQRLKTWTLRAWSLEDAIQQASEWRAGTRGGELDPAELYRQALAAVDRESKKLIRQWRKGPLRPRRP